MSQHIDNSIHIFGIRHHGPGSARSVQQALENLQPDVILVEGPPDAEEILPLLNHAEMRPPVALLLYSPDDPSRAVYYPFAVFSPEWQAIKFGLTRSIPVRFMDLPQAHQLAVTEPDAGDNESPDELATATQTHDSETTEEAPTEEERAPLLAIRQDPISALAQAAGYEDGERWWEHMVEQRRDGEALFDGILEAMTSLRDAGIGAPVYPHEEMREAQREAYMRRTIRQAQHEGFKKIAAVCGAWHGPALATMPSAESDKVLLDKLPKVKVQATWVPWTYGRLSYRGGYGAGIESPGWYHHLWTSPDQITTRWMTRVAHLLREQDLDASPASVIESVRMAETLAALRGRPLPGLPELNEATQAVFCFGSDLPMRLIAEKLIVSETLGEVPDSTPMVPLQQDLSREQKRLRLPVEAAQKVLELDLRKDGDLERSHLLHRLNLLRVFWGKVERASGKGTFHENWRLQWQPEFAVALIEAGIWGNTIRDASAAFARDAADKAPDLPALTGLLDSVMLANLPDAVRRLMDRLQAEAAVASDVTHLMGALPPLANVLRYGNVRRTDSATVGHVVDGLIVRICVGLPGACASLSDEAAAPMYQHIVATNGVIALLQNPDHPAAWQKTLRQLADRQALHGLIAGRCCRVLLDAGVFTGEEAATRMGLALSTATEPPQAAAWAEGFLRGSGQVLIYDEALWGVLDEWVAGLAPETFLELLPLLRRTFATFHAPERRQMGERAARGPAQIVGSAHAGASEEFDPERAARVLPLLAQILGLEMATN